MAVPGEFSGTGAKSRTRGAYGVDLPKPRPKLDQ
jgi:hypothetical protein